MSSILSASWLFSFLKQRDPFKSVERHRCHETWGGSWLHKQNGDFLNESAALKSDFFNSLRDFILCINKICLRRNSETHANKWWIITKWAPRNLANGAILGIATLKRKLNSKIFYERNWENIIVNYKRSLFFLNWKRCHLKARIS